MLTYPIWRRVHLAASAVLGTLAVIHSAVTWSLYSRWTPDAAWFRGTGLGLLLLAALNLAHIGLEPCRQPTTRFIRIANWAFVAFGVAAAWAVPEPQAYVIVLSLALQAVSSRWTLPGPD